MDTIDPSEQGQPGATAPDPTSALQARGRDKHWPAIAAPLVGWLLPATTARRTAHVTLSRAYAVHWLAGLVGVGVVLVLAGWIEASDRGRHWDTLATTVDLLEEGIDELVRAPMLSTVVVLATAVSIEAGFVALALLVAPWGARDESIRASVSSALRRTWQQTSHLALVILMAGLWVGTLVRADRAWRQENPTPYQLHGKVPQPAPGEPADSQAWEDYRATQRIRAAQWDAYYQRRPWYIRHLDIAIGYGCLVAVAWFLWGVFRSLGADRPTTPIGRPPRCEACGYNLTGAVMDGRCPECGEPVVLSLGPGVRPGTAWQRRRELGRWRAWSRCTHDSIARPTWLGRQIRLSTIGTDHRRFLILHLPGVFLIGAIAVPLCYFAAEHRDPFTEPALLWQVCPFAGYFAVVLTIALVLVTAWGTALTWRGTSGRALLVGTMQIVSYLSALLVSGVLFAAMTAMLIFALHDVFEELGKASRIDSVVLAFLAWLALNLIWIAGYMFLAGRGAAGARFANR